MPKKTQILNLSHKDNSITHIFSIEVQMFMNTRAAAHLLLPNRNNSSRNKMQGRKMKNTFKSQNLPSEESHPVTDPLGENSRNPAKNLEKSVLIVLILYQIQ